MVPQLMAEIFHIAQLGKHASHDVYNGIGTPLALGAVFDGQRMVDHILHASPILRKRQDSLLGIIFHK